MKELKHTDVDMTYFTGQIMMEQASSISGPISSIQPCIHELCPLAAYVTVRHIVLISLYQSYVTLQALLTKLLSFLPFNNMK